MGICVASRAGWSIGRRGGGLRSFACCRGIWLLWRSRWRRILRSRICGRARGFVSRVEFLSLSMEKAMRRQKRVEFRDGGFAYPLLSPLWSVMIFASSTSPARENSFFKSSDRTSKNKFPTYTVGVGSPTSPLEAPRARPDASRTASPAEVAASATEEAACDATSLAFCAAELMLSVAEEAVS